MTDKKRREEYDEIIRMSIEMSKENDGELKELTDEDVIKMGYDLPPDDMYDRIIKAAEEAPFRKKKTHIKKSVLLVAIIAVIAIVGVVSGVKHYSFDIDGEVTENAIEFRGTNKNDYVYKADEIAAYKSAEDALGTPILKPTYLPEGFKFDRIKLYPNDRIILMYKSIDKSIKLTQKSLRDSITSGNISDTKNGDSASIEINDNIISLATYQQENTNIIWTSATWSNENIMFNVDTNCNKDELEKFIKNLK